MPEELSSNLKTVCQKVESADFAASGFHLRAWAAPGRIVDVAGVFKDEGLALACLTGVDYVSGTDLVYVFNHHERHLRVAVHVYVDRRGSAPTLTKVFESADWFEREVWEMFGVEFSGHDNLTWLLLPDGAEYRPLLKDFGAVHNVVDDPGDLGLAPGEGEARS